MEIILKEDVVNLGYKNDIVTVKSGSGISGCIPCGRIKSRALLYTD